VDVSEGEVVCGWWSRLWVAEARCRCVGGFFLFYKLLKVEAVVSQVM